MVKRKTLFFLTVFLMLFPVFTVFANVGIYDDAGIFYETEKTSIQLELEDLSTITGWDAAVVTTNNTEEKTSVVYADEYYEKIGYGTNGILYLIDMDNRELYISTTGSVTDYLTDERLDSILDTAVEHASQGNYYETILSEISMSYDFFKSGIPVDQSKIAVKISVISAGVIIGLVSAVLSVLKIFKSYSFKQTGEVYEYTSKSKVNMSVNSDQLINSFITTRIRPKPKNNNRGMGGSGGVRTTTHRASSGRIHGGRGRRF